MPINKVSNLRNDQPSTVDSSFNLKQDYQLISQSVFAGVVGTGSVSGEGQAGACGLEGIIMRMKDQ